VFSARFVASSIVTAGGDGTARVWDELTGQLRQTYRGSRRFLVDATISPDGSMVLAGGADGYLRFWDVASARMIWALQAHRSYVVGVHFEGNDLVTRGFSGDVARWSLPTPAAVIDACGLASEESAGDGQPCVIFPR
jgi:WD40 repeat protein